MNFNWIDYLVFGTYFLLIISVGYYVTKDNSKKNSQDYFLAGKSLSWWVIGASIIASNISAEQFIGMSGSGFAVGLGIATYEWLGALGLILVAKFFLPIYLKNGISTMPEFLEKRFDRKLRISLAVFWILLYWFVNLTSVLYLGAIVLQTILNIPIVYGVLALASVTALYAVFGGLKAVAYTDVIQVVFLVIGGLLTTYYALYAISDGVGIIDGFKHMIEVAPEKFDLILDKSNPNYKLLPGISVILGGLWVANIAYFGFNQYIIQRSLAAKNIKHAQNGLVFAAGLKLLIPILVVLPGIAAFVLKADIAKPDEAYPWVLNNFVPLGVRGLSFAALIAAVISSLSSMVNSAATIFTYDIYKTSINVNASETRLTNVGKILSGLSLVIAVIIAPMLSSLDQVFQFIQNFSGLITPGIVVIFSFGLFYKKAGSKAALWTGILTIPVSLILDVTFKNLPFIDRMGVSFLILSLFMIIASQFEKKEEHDVVKYDSTLFRTNTIFNISSIIIMAVLSVVYYIFW